MRFHARLLASLFFALCAAPAGTTAALAQAEKRVALVVGNSAYQHTSVLPNPKNDAEAVAKLLKGMGFADVRLMIDLDYRGMRESIRLLGQGAADADIALIYFAGHGLEIAGENFLLPVDARLAHIRDLEYEAVSLASVLSAVEGARRLKLLILDACRTNPLGARIDLGTPLTRGLGRGLGRIEPKGEILVAYAAKAGTLALDGDGGSRHSPYAQALLKHMPTPGLDVIRMFGRVKEAVIETTGSAQEPWIYGSPGGEAIALVPAIAKPAPPEKVPPPPPTEVPGAKLHGVWGEHASACKDFKEEVGPAWASGKYFRISETYFDRCQIDSVQPKGAELHYELACRVEDTNYRKTIIASLGSDGRLLFKSRQEHEEHFGSLQKYRRCE